MEISRSRRGFAREVAYLLLIAACVFVAYLVARGDAATMAAAFIRRVRAMGQPE
jgi:hypothetical protein